MVFVISSTGKKLMPTNEYRARKLLKKNKAKICKYTPFTIQLLLKEDGTVQMIRRAETPKDYFATFDFCDIIVR